MKTILLIVIAIATAGCGAVESMKGTLVGVSVEEHETEHLVCATVLIGGAASVSCVRKE